MTTRKTLPMAFVGCTLAADAVSWLTCGSTQLTAAKPEAGPMPRPVPLFAETEPAKNPIRLHLQEDGRKIHGWVSGTEDFSGRPIYVKVGDEKEWRHTEVKLDK